MSRKSCFCWIFLWSAACAVSADILSNESITWYDAKSRNNFATPSILVKNSTFIVNIPTDLNDNKEVWVGYYKKGTAFAYIGCGFINNAKPTILLPESRNSPGLCYSMCNKYYHQYIGLNKDQCFCMKEKPIENISLPKCDISPNGTWVAGGGSEYMSIYERLITEVNVGGDAGRNKDNEECLIFENNHGLRWSDCLHVYLSLCLKEAIVQTASHNSMIYIKWSHYVKTCFENNCFPITYNDTLSLSISQANGPSWTNVIRSAVIYKYYESSNVISANSVSKYGYITKRGNITLLSFTKSSNGSKRYLLQTTTKPEDVNTLPTGDGTSLSEATGVQKTSAFLIYNDTFISSTDGIVNNLISSPDSYDVIIPISVTVTIVILVAVIVIVILMLRKRGKIPSTGIKCSALSICFRRTPDQLPSETNAAYENFQEAGNERIGELNYYVNVDARQDLHLDNINTYCSIDPVAKETDTYDILDPNKT